jgi:pyrroloquinoline quinone (PQQ) biosynthesis protein C
MEHFKSPFTPRDFAGVRAIENQRFFEKTLERAQRHRFYSHPFLTMAEQGTLGCDLVAYILTSFYKVVSPFTGLLCALGGRSPNLRCRFALMDNIYEEMGCGDLESAHPNLYLKMLASIGVSAEEAESTSTLPAVRRINQHLQEVVLQRHFSVACAVLASAEAAIPPSFPILAAIAKDAYPDVDMTFFDRHGPRDDGHADDASTLFALSSDRSQFAAVEAEVMLDLDYRSELFDEWLSAIASGAPRPWAQTQRPPSISVPPPVNPRAA